MPGMIATFKKHPLPVLLAVIILLLHLPVLFAPDSYLLSSWFNTDDAFYYFVTARNVATGHGFTFDGIAHTNGFHPLWMFILIPIFAIPDLILPLRLLAALLILLNLGTALLLYRLTRRHFSPGVAFLTALTFSLLRIIHTETTKGGVEAGLNVFLITLLLNRLADTDLRNLRGVLLTSVVASLTFLARLDNIFFAGFGGMWLLLKQWHIPGPQTSEVWYRTLPKSLRSNFGSLVAYFLPFMLVVVAYMTWNQIGFGTLTPVSGQVKRWWGTLPNTPYGFPPKRLSNYIGQFVTDDESIGPWAIITGPFYRTAEGLISLTGQAPTTGARRVALAGLGVLLIGLVGWLGWKNRAWVGKTVSGLGLLPLLAGCLLQIAYYKVGGSVAERTWYWLPEMLVVVLASGMVLEMLWRATGHSLLNTQYVSRPAYLVTFLLALFLIWPHLTRIPRMFSAETRNTEPYYLRRANWIEANTEPGALIGLTGSGSTGYFVEGRTIVNLDGLISSVTYFDAMKAGTADQYLAEIGLDYVFGNAYIVQESDPYGGIFEGRLEEVGTFLDEDRELELWKFSGQ
ncbi:MAG: hypothetical protein H6636_12030 [Anaerolineales bacterium]|nr:hypothetical protein [Anaerolineales bacterium]